MEILKMTQDDLHQIQDLYIELVPDGCSLETLTMNYQKTADNKNYALLVAKEKDVVLGSAIGMIFTALDTPFLVIENVVVREDCRGKGIGSASMPYWFLPVTARGRINFTRRSGSPTTSEDSVSITNAFPTGDQNNLCRRSDKNTSGYIRLLIQ